MNKMAIRIYTLIITLNLKRLNAPTKRLTEYIQKQDQTGPVYMLSTRNPLQIQGESEVLGKGIPCQWKSKESWNNNTHIRQNRL